MSCYTATPADSAVNQPQPVLPVTEVPANTEISYAEPTPDKNDIHTISPSPDPDDPSKIYIPKDLDDCFVELNRMLHPEWIEEYKTVKKGAEIDQHFGLGLWIRNNWGLWRNSRLKEHLQGLGLFHPDDMSGLILTSYHRHLNQEPLRVEEQVKEYLDYWMGERVRR